MCSEERLGKKCQNGNLGKGPVSVIFNSVYDF